MKVYIGLNDLTSANMVQIVEVESLGGMVSNNDLNTAIQDLVSQYAGAGGIADLLEPVEGDPHFEGYQRLVITVGPPETEGREDDDDDPDTDRWADEDAPKDQLDHFHNDHYPAKSADY